MKFEGDQDIEFFQFLNYCVHKASSLPTTAEVGQLMLRTTDSVLFVYTSTGWQGVGGT